VAFYRTEQITPWWHRSFDADFPPGSRRARSIVPRRRRISSPISSSLRHRYSIAPSPRPPSLPHVSPLLHCSLTISALHYRRGGSLYWTTAAADDRRYELLIGVRRQRAGDLPEQVIWHGASCNPFYPSQTSLVFASSVSSYSPCSRIKKTRLNVCCYLGNLFIFVFLNVFIILSTAMGFLVVCNYYQDIRGWIQHC
jgi:hypothetical protein